jgi:Tol biopolymer transport system component
MRTYVLTLLAVALVPACHLDPSEKPECFVDNDCYFVNKGHCREQVCYANVEPTGVPDVVYVGPLVGDQYSLEADILANDIDPDGDTLSIYDVVYAGSFSKTATGMLSVYGDDPLPITTTYRVTDGRETSGAVEITVARLATTATIRVESGTSATVTSPFAGLVDTSPASLQLKTPPAHGILTGTLPALTYVPDADYCGTDSATFTVHAANGDFELVVTFEVGILLADDQQTVELGAPTAIDVLANDRSGLEVLSTNTTWATPDGTGAHVIVDPPFDQATSYAVVYTARDSRGCTGKATISLGVEFPTRVIVGTGLTGDAFDASQSDDGRYVAFTSADSTLVAGDTNGAADVFVLDVQTNAVERVSIATGGAQANESSTSPSISADGRYVAFVSRATNLDAKDTTSVEDIYVRDRVANTTTLVSVSVDNTGSDQASLTPHISASGTRIVFASTATRLVDNDTNAVMDIFVRDIGTAATQRVSVTAAGAQVPYASDIRPRISGNGRYVALSSSASLDGSNSGGSFLVDTSGSAVSRIDPSDGEVDVDDAGRFVIQADYQVTLIDRVVENTTNLGLGTFPTLSGSGRYVAYVDGKHITARGGGTPFDAIVDRTGAVIQVTPLRRPELSGNGRWIVFSTSEWPGHVGRFVIVRVWNRAYVD